MPATPDYYTMLGVHPKASAEVVKAAYRALAEYGGSRAIIMGRQLFSLLMTKDEYHGHQWHISMVEITGPRSMREMDQANRELVLNNFFSKWIQIPNPGQQVEILHFVGND